MILQGSVLVVYLTASNSGWGMTTPQVLLDLAFQLLSIAAAVTEGGRRRFIHGGPDHRRTSRDGNPRIPARAVMLQYFA